MRLKSSSLERSAENTIFFLLPKNLLKNSDTIDSESEVCPLGVDANNKKTDDHGEKKFTEPKLRVMKIMLISVDINSELQIIKI